MSGYGQGEQKLDKLDVLEDMDDLDDMDDFEPGLVAGRDWVWEPGSDWEND